MFSITREFFVANVSFVFRNKRFECPELRFECSTDSRSKSLRPHFHGSVRGYTMWHKGCPEEVTLASSTLAAIDIAMENSTGRLSPKLGIPAYFLFIQRLWQLRIGYSSPGIPGYFLLSPWVTFTAYAHVIQRKCSKRLNVRYEVWGPLFRFPLKINRIPWIVKEKANSSIKLDKTLSGNCAFLY